MEFQKEVKKFITKIRIKKMIGVNSMKVLYFYDHSCKDDRVSFGILKSKKEGDVSFSFIEKNKGEAKFRHFYIFNHILDIVEKAEENTATIITEEPDVYKWFYKKMRYTKRKNIDKIGKKIGLYPFLENLEKRIQCLKQQNKQIKVIKKNTLLGKTLTKNKNQYEKYEDKCKKAKEIAYSSLYENKQSNSHPKSYYLSEDFIHLV